MGDASQDGFFSRWSSRKAQAREGKPLSPEPPRPPATPAAAPLAAATPAVAVNASPQPSAPPPTLNDVTELTPASDFSAFVRREVAPEVKNAALKKLFADPHFNQMDGLDVYIDDYSLPDPLPPGMLAQMTSVDFLRANEPPAPPLAPEPVGDSPEPAGVDSVAQSDPSSCPDTPDHDDADLRLQPDPAARRQGPGPESV